MKKETLQSLHKNLNVAAKRAKRRVASSDFTVRIRKKAPAAKKRETEIKRLPPEKKVVRNTKEPLVITLANTSTVKKAKLIAHRRFSQIFAIALIIGMNYAGLSAVGRTVAVFHDTEVSMDNYFSAGSLDFIAHPSSFEKSIDAGESARFSVTLDKASSTIPFRQGGHFEWLTVEDRALCSAMELILVASSLQLYRGPLIDFSYPRTTTIGVLDFEIIATTTRSAIPYGEKCKFNFVFDAAQEPELQNGGFSDTEMVEITLNARRGVVLNEFLPNPIGRDSAGKPNGEWVELYNNGDSPRDLSGWYTRDSTDGEGNRVFVTVANTLSATTTIPSHGFLVVYMNKAIFNNDRDTVRLFDSADNLVDSEAYCGPLGRGGACGGIAEGKSFARIPDGIGEWVDPIPTPGEPNIADIGTFDEGEFSESNESEEEEDATVTSDDTERTVSPIEETESASIDDDVAVLPEGETSELAQLSLSEPITHTEPAEESPAVSPAEETRAVTEPVIIPEETVVLLSEEITSPSN